MVVLMVKALTSLIVEIRPGFCYHCFFRIPLSVFSKFCPHPTDFILLKKINAEAANHGENFGEKDE